MRNHSIVLVCWVLFFSPSPLRCGCEGDTAAGADITQESDEAIEALPVEAMAGGEPSKKLGTRPHFKK